MLKSESNIIGNSVFIKIKITPVWMDKKQTKTQNPQYKLFGNGLGSRVSKCEYKRRFSKYES